MGLQRSATATEIKNLFGSYLGDVLKRREPLFIKKHKKPVAVLVDYKTWTDRTTPGAGRETTWTTRVRRMCERMKRRHPDQKPFSAVELVNSIREEES